MHAFQALGGVAVLATHSHAAIQGRNQLQTQWNASPHDGYDTEAYRSALLETASKGGKVVRQKGLCQGHRAFEKAGQLLRASLAS